MIQLRTIILSLLLLLLIPFADVSAQSDKQRQQENWITFAVSMYDKGDFDGAMTMLKSVIDQDPECDAAYYYMAYTGHVMGTKIETDMRRDAYAHLHKLSNSYFNNTKVGQIMGRITNDLFDVTEFSHHCPEEFLSRELRG